MCADPGAESEKPELAITRTKPLRGLLYIIADCVEPTCILVGAFWKGFDVVTKIFPCLASVGYESSALTNKVARQICLKRAPIAPHLRAEEILPF